MYRYIRPLKDMAVIGGAASRRKIGLSYQGQELLTGSGIFLESAKHGGCDRHRILLFYAPHGHAKVQGLDNHGHAFWLKMLL